MNSHNPRLERLKELMSLEERRVSLQQELESLTERMGSLRDALFEESGAAVSRPAASSSVRSEAPAQARVKRGPAKRAQRGALKEQIVSALESAGSAGVRVTELAKSLGIKPVNIHSWFHSSIKRYPQIKKLQGGHYRLEGKLNGTAPSARGETAAKATPAKATPAKAAGRGGSTSGRSNRGGRNSSGSRRGQLSEQVLGELRKAGSKGITVRDLANKIGANYRNIYIWFATTGKKNSGIKKVAPAQYRLVG